MSQDKDNRSISSTEMSAALANGIGGSRGLIDSSLPTAIFLVVYLATGSQLMPSVWAAVGGGVVVAILRKVRGEPLQQVFAGLIGVGIAAFLAARTGRAEDFFLPGILINIAYGAGFAISALIRRPLVGYAAGAVSGDLTSWYRDSDARRAATTATWLWAGMFAFRVIVQLPLYLAGLVGPLGAAKLVMGWPLFLLVAYVSYRIMSPVLRRVAQENEEAEAHAERSGSAQSGYDPPGPETGDGADQREQIDLRDPDGDPAA